MSRYKIIRYISFSKKHEKEIRKTMNHFTRKERYMEHDLKREIMVIDVENEKVLFYPSREDSYERLSENEVQFKGGESAEEDVMKKLLIEKLWEEISKLPEQERKILLLTALEGKSQKEISARLGINQSNVSRKLKAIRNELKSKLKDYL